MIGSPVESTNCSTANYCNGVGRRDDGSEYEDSTPIDSRNVSGSDDFNTSCSEGESRADGDGEDSSFYDSDRGSDLCTRDEEFSVPDDDQHLHQNVGHSFGSDGGWDRGRPVVPPLDLRLFFQHFTV